MTCCSAHRDRPTLFIVVVALSAVAFLGQAIGTPATDAATALAVQGLAAAPARR